MGKLRFGTLPYLVPIAPFTTGLSGAHLVESKRLQFQTLPSGIAKNGAVRRRKGIKRHRFVPEICTDKVACTWES